MAFGELLRIGFSVVLLFGICTLAGPVSAADLGGGCCADLDERMAELEATAARKGNRVVSLQISGFINEALMIWDDGVQRDAYVVTNTGYPSRLSLTGAGVINPDVKAGFVVTFGIFGSPSYTVDQTNDESISTATGARADEIFIRESKAYIESTRFGRVSLGQQSSSSDEITALNVARSVYVDSSSQQVFVGSFRLRDGDTLTGFRFANLMGSDHTNPPGDGARFGVIRYDSPSVAGFKVSASWGENDMWDVALRYYGLLGGRFKTAAGIAYLARTDGDVSATSVPGTTSGRNGCIFDAEKDVDCRMLGMSGSIMDMGTGLFIHGAYGITADDNKPGSVDETSFWYLHGGIEKKWIDQGATTLFAVYGAFDTGFNRGVQSAQAIGSFENGEATLWGLGVNQNFESAAVDLYMKYNHYTASADNVTVTGAKPLDHVEFNDFDIVYAGARITF